MNAPAFTRVMAEAARAPMADLSTLTGTGDILVLAPHPDDESLAVGGAIAAASEAGHRVHVVVVTDGSRSHPNSASHPAATLAALRRAEVTEATAILTGGREKPLCLGYPDQQAPDDPATFAALEARLADRLATTTAIWTTWRGDPHTDHQRVWRLARFLADRRPGVLLYGGPVWGRVQAPVDDASTRGLLRFDTRDHQRTKAEAVAAHVSQMTGLIDDDPDGFRMPADLAAHFVHSEEIFIPS